MMKKYWHIALLMCCVLITLPSCNKDEDEMEIDMEWYQENIDYFDMIAKDPSYKEISSPGNNGSIYYKVIKVGDGSDPRPIYYNSVIEVYYTGWLINKSGDDYFDSRENPWQESAKILLSDFIQGWHIACANMHVGDRWEVWIPYQLAYGIAGDGSIPGCSTLHFEIEIVSIIDQ